jgi:hypothetical protein
LAAGFLVVLLMKIPWGGRALDSVLAYPWQMVVATAVAFAVCCTGRPATQAAARPVGLGAAMRSAAAAAGG